MNSILRLTLPMLAGAGALAAGVYHYKTSTMIRPANAVIARDRSYSMLGDCNGTEALFMKAINDSKMGRGSNVTVIASGDEKTADEPVLIGTYNVPTTRSVIEGRNATSRKQQALLEDLKTKCELLPMTKRSPIVLLIRRGIERVRQMGCSLTAACIVYVQTDGEETAETQVKQLFDSIHPSKQGVASPLIDNQGIDLVFFGLSQTVGETETAAGRRHRVTHVRDFGRAERLHDGWLSVFSDPKRVRFEPFCPTN
jgi:hypothetical protein